MASSLSSLQYVSRMCGDCANYLQWPPAMPFCILFVSNAIVKCDTLILNITALSSHFSLIFFTLAHVTLLIIVLLSAAVPDHIAVFG